MPRRAQGAIPGDIRKALDDAGERPDPADTSERGRANKKNYAERLSRAIATLVANALRTHFPDIKPGPAGQGQESRARTAKGVKKLDVNYSTPELGLGLGVSIKTINFRDPSTGRYTKNYTRADNELRAEAQDYHLRQPYAVMVAAIFIPADSCDQVEAKRAGRGSSSSFGQAIRIFRHRAGREKPKDVEELFERVFVAIYEHEGNHRGEVSFFDVMKKPPRFGRPRKVLRLEEFITEIRRTYDKRNNPPFEWAENGNGENGGGSAPSE